DADVAAYRDFDTDLDVRVCAGGKAGQALGCMRGPVAGTVGRVAVDRDRAGRVERNVYAVDPAPVRELAVEHAERVGAGAAFGRTLLVGANRDLPADGDRVAEPVGKHVRARPACVAGEGDQRPVGR